MDPFSSEGELLALYNAFFHGQYHLVLQQDLSTLSAENSSAGRVYALRARIELGEAAEVAAELSIETTPELAIVRALALYKAGNVEDAIATAEPIIADNASNTVVQVVGAIVLQLDGKSDEALALLSNHQGSMEAVALTVQIHLINNRMDAAVKEVTAAKRWAQDSLLINFAESWVGLRTGGEGYQQAYYVYEELAQAPATSAVLSLVGQAVSEIHLGRLPEAEVALQQASDKSAENPHVLSNSAVLSVLLGNDPSNTLAKLRSIQPHNTLIAELDAKNDLFDKASARFSIKT